MNENECYSQCHPNNHYVTYPNPCDVRKKSLQKSDVNID